jgi:RHS repeat-associated protein
LNLRLPGQYFDAETGLHQNGYRDYDARLGRYLESDPIGLEGGLNPYLYANANPLRYVDPAGLFVGDPAEWTAVVKAVEAATSVTASTIAAGVAGVVAAVYPRPVGEGSDVVPKNCPPDDECKRLELQIKAVAAELRGRYFDMLSDRSDLYNNAFSSPNLGKRRGTWLGHQQQFKDQQQRLKKLIDLADSKGCKVDPFDRALLSASVPTEPAAR